MNTLETDDLGLSPEFLADEDIARDEDNYNPCSRCTCGRDRYYQEGYYPGDPHWEGDGCRGCNPPDHDSKPYGFGIEAWEDPSLMAAKHAAWPNRRHLLISEATYQKIMREARTTYRPRLARLSDIVWDRICDCASSHPEAVRMYKTWAKRAVKLRFRDE